MVLRRQFAQRRPARGVDEGQMSVTFDHAWHQELARGVDSIRSVGGQRLGLRRDRDKPFAFDEHFARKGRGASAIPHHGIVNQLRIKGTLYHYPNINTRQILSVAGAPAPHKIGEQIYVQALMTQMAVRYFREAMEKILDRAANEFEGFTRN